MRGAVAMPQQATSAFRRSAKRAPAALVLGGVLAVATWLCISAGVRSFVQGRPVARSEIGVETEEATLVPMNRRLALGGLGAAVAAPAMPAMAFESFSDASKGYAFKYPTGLEKFDRKGYSTFLRDLIEPLEFIGVQTVPTKRKDIDEIGTTEEIAAKMMKELVPATAPQELISAKEVKKNGNKYVTIEYAFQWKFDQDTAEQLGRKSYQLHAKALLAVSRKKQYILSTGAEEPRWQVHGEGLLDTCIQTFQLLNDNY